MKYHYATHQLNNDGDAILVAFETCEERDRFVRAGAAYIGANFRAAENSAALPNHGDWTDDDAVLRDHLGATRVAGWVTRMTGGKRRNR